MTETKEDKTSTFPATVVKIIDENKVVINRGSTDGIKTGQRFLIYKLEDDPIKDPETGEDLGYLEVIRGTGKIIHVQGRLSTIESDKTEQPEKRIIKRRNPAWDPFGSQEEIITPSSHTIPFEEAKKGDKAKPI